MQVAKWGNSLAVRLPSSVVSALDLQAGDDIEITLDTSRHFVVRKQPSIDDLIAQLRRFRGKMPSDFKFNREEANERVAIHR